MFELLAVPQRDVPYVQTGFRIVLLISNLFSIDNSDFIPRIQYVLLEFQTQLFSFSKYVSSPRQSSRWIPKYLVVSACGITVKPA
jgi:hypothetical protein